MSTTKRQMRRGEGSVIRREGGLLLVMAAALYLLISLLSFDPADPAWSHSGWYEQPRNLGGVVGALLADLSFYFLGYGAYVCPPLLVLLGWQLLHRGRGKAFEAWPKAAGLLLVVAAGCGLAELHAGTAGHWLPGPPGGILGMMTGGRLALVLNLPGATLVLAVLLVFGIQLASGMSLFAAVELVGVCTLQLLRLAKAGLMRLREWLRGLWRRSRSPTGNGDARQAQVEDRDCGTRVEPRLAALPELPVAQRVEEPPVVETLDDSRPPRTIDVAPVALHARQDLVQRPEPEADPEPVIRAFQVAGDGDGVLPAADRGRSAGNQGGTRADLTDPAPEPAGGPPAPGCSAQAPAGILELPPMDLLDAATVQGGSYPPEILEALSRQVEEKLLDFGIQAEVVEVQPGPVITRFELQPAPGIKASRITNLSRDLARGLSVLSVRVVEVIPGKPYIGLEIPNRKREVVYLSEVLESRAYKRAGSPLTLAMGKDIGGKPVVANLAKMPHLLVAGTTGSGKSVAVNAMLLSILYKSSPDQVRLILVDPKMLELSVYEGIPHLLAPVVTDMKDAANALRWCVAEMERRYRLMASLKVRNIAGFNDRVVAALEQGEVLLDPLQPATEEDGEPERLQPLPFIVVVIDELADLMMVVGKKVEELIARLAQKARAAGIHLILATQRPSVDVITGLIKANIPTRVAFQVSSRVDSRTILDQIGAENLLGNGDMLYLPPGSGFPQRLHGAFVADHEVNAVAEFLKSTGGANYLDGILEESVDGSGAAAMEEGGGADSELDPLYDKAVFIVTESRRASASGIQRRLKIGYNRAARLIEAMEEAGIVSAPGSNGMREVIAPPAPGADPG